MIAGSREGRQWRQAGLDWYPAQREMPWLARSPGERSGEDEQIGGECEFPVKGGNGDLFGRVVKSHWKPQKIMVHNVFSKWHNRPQNDKERETEKKIFYLEGPELKAKEKGLQEGTASLLSIPSKLTREVKLFFNLHLHNYIRIIKNTVLGINFGRYMSSHEKLRVSRENNFV